jgi:hypothetical protein
MNHSPRLELPLGEMCRHVNSCVASGANESVKNQVLIELPFRGPY